MSDPTKESNYQIVATIREGRIVSTITSRVVFGVPRFSFSILKEYERDGETQHSRWMELLLLNDLMRALEKTKAFIEKEMAKNPTNGQRR